MSTDELRPRPRPVERVDDLALTTDEAGYLAVLCPICGRATLSPRAGDPAVSECSLCGHCCWQTSVDTYLKLAYEVSVNELHMRQISPAIQGLDPATSRAARTPMSNEPATGLLGKPNRAVHGTRNLLLILGVTSLLVAALFFVAVVWVMVGGAGRIVVLGVCVALLAGMAHVFRKKIPATSEALGATAIGVLTIVGWSAPALGALPASAGSITSGYPALVAAVSMGVSVALHSLSKLRAYRWTFWLLIAVGAALLAPPIADVVDWPILAALTMVPLLIATVGLALIVTMPSDSAHGMAATSAAPWVALIACSLPVAAATLLSVNVSVEFLSWRVYTAVLAVLLLLLANRFRRVTQVSPTLMTLIATLLLSMVLGVTLGNLPAVAGLPTVATVASFTVVGSGIALAVSYFGQPSLRGYLAAVAVWLFGWVGLLQGSTDQDLGTSLGVFFLIVAISLAVLARANRAARYVWLAATAGSLSITFFVAQLNVTGIEWSSLPVAALLAGAAFWVASIEPGSPTTASALGYRISVVRNITPAFFVALVPTAVWTFDGPARFTDGSWVPSLRWLVAVGVGAALVWIGVWLKQWGMGIAGAGSFGFAAVSAVSQPDALLWWAIAWSLTGLLLVSLIPVAVRFWVVALAWTGAVAAGFAWVLWGQVWGFDYLEEVTLPIALVFAIAGWFSARVNSAKSHNTLTIFGPGIAMALIPSAVATWAMGRPFLVDSPAELARWSVVMLVAAVVVIVGARQGWAGAFVPGVAALLIAGINPVVGLVVRSVQASPGWLIFTVCGVLLILAGARIEWLKDQTEKSARWVRQLR